MVIADFEVNLNRKFQLGKDIVEEIEAVQQLPEPEPPGWSPLFEPISFNEAHGPLLIKDYLLS